jgi:hypothetical protein
MISFIYTIFFRVHHCEVLLCTFDTLSYFSLLHVQAYNLFWMNNEACFCIYL